jgi:hypothetical protein
MRMILYQIEEHLLAVEQTNPPLYFVGRHQKELIEGYAKAYEVDISFY